MSARAIKYAEDQLGVHAVYEQAQANRAVLDKLLAELDKAQDDKRRLAEEIADREAELLIEERGKHSDMSAAAFDQHTKSAKRKDPELKKLREAFNGSLSEIQGLEYDVDMAKVEIRIACSRMEELGGYLNYLAAVKAETTSKTNQTGSQA